MHKEHGATELREERQALQHGGCARAYLPACISASYIHGYGAILG